MPVSVCVCRFDETGRAVLGGRPPWPPYLGPSVSISQHDKNPPTPHPPPFCHDPSPLGHQCPHVYSITVHYPLPGQCLEISPVEATGRERDKDKKGSDFTKERERERKKKL